MNDDDDEDSRSTTLQLPDYLGCLYLKEDWLGQPNVPLDLIALLQVIASQIYMYFKLLRLSLPVN